MKAFCFLISLLFISHFGYSENVNYESLKKESAKMVTKIGKLVVIYHGKLANQNACYEEAKWLEEVATDEDYRQAIQTVVKQPHKAMVMWLRHAEYAADQLSSCLSKSKDNACKKGSDLAGWMGADKFAQCYCRGEEIICPSYIDDADCEEIYDSGAGGLYAKCPCHEASNLGITCED